MSPKYLLREAGFLASTYASEPVVQNAALLGAAVALLNGQIVDDGKAIAHAAAALLAAEYVGVRAWSLEVLQSEIATARSSLS